MNKFIGLGYIGDDPEGWLMKIEIRVLNKQFYATNPLPSYATAGSAGIDLVCTKDITIMPQERVTIPTGLAVWIGSNTKNLTAVINKEAVEGLGIMGMIVPRSGLGTKGLVLANTVGIIDRDYQGELMVSAWNRNPWAVEEGMVKRANGNELVLKAGDRFCQLVFMPVIRVQWDVVEEFSDETDRGKGGFGSSGV